MIVSYSNRTARWLLFHLCFILIHFLFFEKMCFLPIFRKKYIFYLINHSLNLSGAWIDILFHQKSLISIINLLSENMLLKSMSIQKLWRKVWHKFQKICSYKISWYETSINFINSFFMTSNLICTEFYVYLTHKRSWTFFNY